MHPECMLGTPGGKNRVDWHQNIQEAINDVQILQLTICTAQE